MRPFFRTRRFVSYHGDAETVLRELPSASVDCVVTSPPYFSLRRHLTGPGEIDHESTVDAYVGRLAQVGRELLRVVNRRGSLWLILLLLIIIVAIIAAAVLVRRRKAPATAMPPPGWQQPGMPPQQPCDLDPPPPRTAVLTAERVAVDPNFLNLIPRRKPAPGEAVHDHFGSSVRAVSGQFLKHCRQFPRLLRQVEQVFGGQDRRGEVAIRLRADCFERLLHFERLFEGGQLQRNGKRRHARPDLHGLAVPGEIRGRHLDPVFPRRNGQPELPLEVRVSSHNLLISLK